MLVKNLSVIASAVGGLMCFDNVVSSVIICHLLVCVKVSVEHSLSNWVNKVIMHVVDYEISLDHAYKER